MAYDKPRMGYRHTLVWLLYTIFFSNSIGLATKKRWRKFRMNNGSTKLYFNFNTYISDYHFWKTNKTRKRCSKAQAA